MVWEPKTDRGRSAATCVVSRDRGRDRGPLERDRGRSPTAAGWALRGRAVAEGVLHQNLERRCSRRAGAALAARAPLLRLRGAPARRDPATLLEAAIRGGVDVIQLREKAPRCAEELIAVARAVRPRGARARRAVLPQRRPGPGRGLRRRRRPRRPGRQAGRRGPRGAPGRRRSSGSRPTRPRQFDAALAAEGAARPDQISAGPVWETPTKEGRPAAGLELIEHAAGSPSADVAWFAIGGIDAANVGEVVAAGRSGSSSCARSATPPIPRPRRVAARGARRLGRLDSSDGQPGAKARRAAQAQGARPASAGPSRSRSARR